MWQLNPNYKVLIAALELYVIFKVINKKAEVLWFLNKTMEVIEFSYENGN
jgi:hypothetical protein